jgi:propanediol dehydratase small subunit
MDLCKDFQAHASEWRLRARAARDAGQKAKCNEMAERWSRAAEAQMALEEHAASIVHVPRPKRRGRPWSRLLQRDHDTTIDRVHPWR